MLLVLMRGAAFIRFGSSLCVFRPGEFDMDFRGFGIGLASLFFRLAAALGPVGVNLSRRRPPKFPCAVV